MKKLLIITILLSATQIRVLAQPELKKVDSSQISASLELCDLSDSLTFKYMRSISAGALVGMGIGIVTAYSDTLAPSWWPITWFLAMNARCDLVSSIGSDMNAHEVKKETTMVISKKRIGNEGQEWLKAFLEKRKPTWSNE